MNPSPEPPIPAGTDLRDFSFTPMYRARLFGSTFHARASDAEWRAGVTLWLKAQDQVPAGSLPDDDIDLCRLAELGRDLKTWGKVKAGALHGWFKCSDGRLYNRVVAEVVLEQLAGKIEQRRRTLKARIAALEKRLADAVNDDTKADLTEQIRVLRLNLSQALSQVGPPTVTAHVTESVTASKGQGQGQGQGQGESKIDSLPRNSATAPLASPNGSAKPQGDPSFFELPDRLKRTNGAPPVEPEATGATAAPAKRGTRLPDDWKLTPELRAAGAKARAKHKLPAIDLDLEADRFADYWHAKSGAAATKVDWLATWRNWCRNSNAPPLAPGVRPLGVGG